VNNLYAVLLRTTFACANNFSAPQVLKNIMKIKSKPDGFTLVEIMIVVAIIGLLAAIAVPNYVGARKKAQQSACIRNLQQIDGAKEQWALEKKKSAGSPVVDAEVNDYIKNVPKCPGGGTYSYGAVDTSPACTIEGHAL